MTSRSAIAWSPCVPRRHFPSIRSWEAPRDCLAASRAPLRPWSHRAHATFAWAVEREDLGERRSRWHGGRVKATTAMARTRVRHNNGKGCIYLARPRNTIVHRLRKTVTPHPLPPRTNSLRRQLRCTSPSTGEKATLGFAVGKFCFPKNEWRADRELCKRADTVAIEAASINSAYA